MKGSLCAGVRGGAPAYGGGEDASCGGGDAAKERVSYWKKGPHPDPLLEYREREMEGQGVMVRKGVVCAI